MVKIMLDSAADGKNIHPCDYHIPIQVDIDGVCYQDGVDLTADAFYNLLPQCREFPKTSQPSPESFISAFEDVKSRGDELVYLCLSSALSGTYQGANIAKEIVDYEGIHIVDTRAATHMIGMLAQYAAKLAAEGIGGTEITEKVMQLRKRQTLYAGLGTLEYLCKGGRLNRTSAAIGTVANIKPIITVGQGGEVEPVAKAIGIKRAIATIAKFVQEAGFDESFPIWSLCTAEDENCEALEAALADLGIQVTGRMQVGPTIGAHVGPGAYGIVFVTK